MPVAVSPIDAEVRAHWADAGSPVPPPAHLKQAMLAAYARATGAHVFVETGTYFGETTAAMVPHFDRLYSIEAEPGRAANAVAKFQTEPKVRIFEGDSAKVLPGLLRTITEPALFWLDGHVSGEGSGRGDRDTPIVQELETIFAHPIEDHVILIDDARLFVGKNDYPRVEHLRQWITSVRPGWKFEVVMDVIRVHG